jgi:hypothetical protein
VNKQVIKLSVPLLTQKESVYLNNDLLKVTIYAEHVDSDRIEKKLPISAYTKTRRFLGDFGKLPIDLKITEQQLTKLKVSFVLKLSNLEKPSTYFPDYYMGLLLLLSVSVVVALLNISFLYYKSKRNEPNSLAGNETTKGYRALVRSETL